MDIELILRLSFAGAAIFIGLLLGIALLTSKKANKNINFLLLVIIIFYVGQTMDSFLMFSGLYKSAPHFVLAVYPLSFLIGAVYYFYIRVLLEPSFKFRWYDAIHLVLMIRTAYLMKWLYVQSSSDKVNTLKYMWFDNPNKPSFFNAISWSEDEFLTIFYLLATIKLINLTLKSLKSKSSNTDIEYLSWLKKSTYIFAALTFLEIIRGFVVVYYDLNAGKSEIISSIILLGYIIYLVFQIIRNPERVFYKLNTEVAITNKYRFSFRVEVFFKNIARLFNKKEIYNDRVYKAITTMVLLGGIYCYFFNWSVFYQSNWCYFTIVMFLFFMIFQFTIIDNDIIYQSFKVVNSEFVEPELNTGNNLSSKIYKNDSSFLVSLKAIMEIERPYLNPNLKSHELANLLDMTPHNLSKSINQELGQNFYSFINSYRVEEFKKRVMEEDNKNFTLVSISEEVGFNSKSSFNRIFKASSGITPSEYIKNLKKGVNFQK